MKRIISGYKMELYALQRSSFTSYSGAECLPPDLKLTLLDDDLLDEAKAKWPNKYRQWRSALENSGKQGGGVAIALVGSEMVAYGQLKTEKVNDTFYRVGKNTAYLSSFYTDPNYRGKSIYPAVISYLVEAYPEYNEFFISVYTTNHSSKNGLMKVGFVPIKTFKFIRVLKMTLNKKRISSERK